ncbi:hypothetical protein L596_028234 [Steinernema carpocapsae]|uniref:Secreted mucin n=1 Tax=Steinernema carpocapsae TaxID=34508 RepID=A0A4U5LXY4_STECR|nr:hypothetical protein L596_028234 [Steinernema carpocapsae]
MMRRGTILIVFCVLFAFAASDKNDSKASEEQDPKNSREPHDAVSEKASAEAKPEEPSTDSSELQSGETSTADVVSAEIFSTAFPGIGDALNPEFTELAGTPIPPSDYSTAASDYGVTDEPESSESSVQSSSPAN